MDMTEDAIFTACLDDVSSMSKILQELHSVQEHAILVITPEGIRTLTGDPNYQVSAFFATSMFQRFKFDQGEYERVTFRFILKDFIEILNLHKEENDEGIAQDDRDVLTNKTSLYIMYKKKGDPLELKLENKSNIVIHCELRAFSTSNNVLFAPLQYELDEELCVITLNSKKMYDFVIGLDLSTSRTVDLSMGRNEPLKLTTNSELGESELEIKLSNSDVIRGEIQAPTSCVFKNKYKTAYVKPALEALKNSQLMQMKCSSNGLLSLQHFHQFDINNGAAAKAEMNDYHNGDDFDVITANSRVPSIEYFILAQAIPNYDLD